MAGDLSRSEGLPDYKPWEPEDLESFAQRQVKLPTAESIERIHQEAHREGYEVGHREGMAAGYEEGRSHVQSEAERLRLLADGLEEALKNFEQELGHELVSLSLEIARQMLTKALKVKPELLLPVVRAAMEGLSQNSQHPQIHLHPEDAMLVREMLSAEHPHAGWKVVEDLRVARGGCRIETSTAELDATLPSRWRLIANALGQDSSWLEDDKQFE
jgi:flagellar assembly protein FliH